MNTTTIDAFFQNELSAKQQEKFLNRIVEDTDFAEQVADYLTMRDGAKNELRETKKTVFKALSVAVIASVMMASCTKEVMKRTDGTPVPPPAPRHNIQNQIK